MKFFDSSQYYRNIKTPGNFQFFITQPDQLHILDDSQEKVLVNDIKSRFDSYNTIVHSVYILSNLDKSWQRKMLIQQYDISKKIKANCFVFHLQESLVQYENLDTLIANNLLVIDKIQCQFALENTSRQLKDPQQYMQQIKKYIKKGMIGVLDIAHVASSGLFKLIQRQSNSSTNNRQSLSRLKGRLPSKFSDRQSRNLDTSNDSNQGKNDPLNQTNSIQREIQRQNIKQIIQFVRKYGKNFEVLHLADQVSFEIGKDLHNLPFSHGTLFTFENMFTSIDLLDQLLQNYNTIVLEFIDKGSMFRNAVSKYLKCELSVAPALISYYVKILRWYETGIQEDYQYNNKYLNSIQQHQDYNNKVVNKSRTQQYMNKTAHNIGQQRDAPLQRVLNYINYREMNYEAIANQLIEICRQPQSKPIYMNSPIWKQYCIPHKVAQLLLIVELTSYFLINKIKIPWEQSRYPPINYYNPEEDVVSRKQATTYINKLIKIKVIKSDKQVFGSYLRGNSFIGDLDILIDKKDKDKIINILQKHIKNMTKHTLKTSDLFKNINNDMELMYIQGKLSTTEIADTLHSQSDDTLNSYQNYIVQPTKVGRLSVKSQIKRRLSLDSQSRLVGGVKNKQTQAEIDYEAEYTITRLLLDDIIKIDIYFASKNNYPMELFLTGNKYFNIYMKRKASQLGFKLTNTQLLTLNAEHSWIPVLLKSEKDIFKYLHIDYIKPKFRLFYNC